MKGLFLAFSFIFMIPTSFAIVIEQNENAIDNDLSFSLSDKETKVRNVASQDKADQNERPKVIPDSEEGETDRDVANDQEKVETKIKYWKY